MNRKKLYSFIGIGIIICFIPFLVSIKNDDDVPFVLETVLKNGMVYYEDSLQPLYVGITYEGTLLISKYELFGEKEIDVSGKIVSPGFIDILADNSSNPKATYQIFEKYKLSDGVTTALQLHGGSGNAEEYYGYFEQKEHWINYGVSTKVMNIRRHVKNHRDRLVAIEENLNHGAIAISHSIEYQPTTFEELLDYAKLARAYQRPLFLHLRYSSFEKELEGVKEAIALAKQSGAHIHIDHLNSTGGTFHMKEALNLIEEANQMDGTRITTCVYPYSYWATYISSRRFEGDWRKRYGIDYSDLTVVGTGEKLNAESFEKYRKKQGVLVAVPSGTQPLSSTFDLAIEKEFCHIGSDGGIEKNRKANNHPRGSGCFATTIRSMLDKKHDLNFILHKITQKPAELLYPSLERRGELINGYHADICVFDPEEIKGMSNPKNPNALSNGISYVFVNGKLAYQNKHFKNKNGIAIKR